MRCSGPQKLSEKADAFFDKLRRALAPSFLLPGERVCGIIGKICGKEEMADEAADSGHFGPCVSNILYSTVQKLKIPVFCEVLDYEK